MEFFLNVIPMVYPNCAVPVVECTLSLNAQLFQHWRHPWFVSCMNLTIVLVGKKRSMAELSSDIKEKAKAVAESECRTSENQSMVATPSSKRSARRLTKTTHFTFYLPSFTKPALSKFLLELII